MMLIIHLQQQFSIFEMSQEMCSEQRFYCWKFCSAPEILNHCLTPMWMQQNKMVISTFGISETTVHPQKKNSQPKAKIQ